MKNIFKSILALLCCGAVLASCEQEVPEVKMSVDVASIEAEAQNPGDVSITLTANSTWILTTPDWVTPSATYGGGDAILTFKIATNYKDATTSTAARSGEIRISGGGSMTGKGAIIVIPITQQGYTYIDPNPSLGGITDLEEFVAFIKAANNGGSMKRWTDDNGEVSLLADVDLSSAEIPWQEIVDETKATNGNNGCTLEGTPFRAIFNGNNHKITGFNPEVVLAANQTFGLFAAISEAVIKNVELTGTLKVTATGQADAGMLVGTSYNSTIQNVKINGEIISTGTTVAKRFALGAVCGFAYGESDKYTTIQNAEVNVNVEIDGGANQANGAGCAMYGGIAGFATGPNAEGSWGVHIKGCTNNGDMNVKLGRCSGILATANCHTIIEDCTNNGDQVNKIANGRLGNIVCNVSHYSTLINCVNNGDLDATAEGYSGTVGGIFALAGSANGCSITGGGNYGTIKTLSSAGKYIGLLWANHNAVIPTTGLVASGRIIVDGVEREINESNYMSNIGSIKNPESVTNITWVAPE